MDPVILLAIIFQGAVAKSSSAAGVLVGFFMTTGVLFWGLSVYGRGGVITLLDVPLSPLAFLSACLLWYLYDFRELLNRQFPKGVTGD